MQIPSSMFIKEALAEMKGEPKTDDRMSKLTTEVKMAIPSTIENDGLARAVANGILLGMTIARVLLQQGMKQEELP